MVLDPLLSEYICFFIDLALDVIAQFLQPCLKFFLESVKSAVHLCHGFDGIFFVFLDLGIAVDEALLQLPLRLDSGVFHVFEVLRHVLHLILELGKVLIVSFLSFYHFITSLPSL